MRNKHDTHEKNKALPGALTGSVFKHHICNSTVVQHLRNTGGARLAYYFSNTGVGAVTKYWDNACSRTPRCTVLLHCTTSISQQTASKSWRPPTPNCVHLRSTQTPHLQGPTRAILQLRWQWRIRAVHKPQLFTWSLVTIYAAHWECHTCPVHERRVAAARF